MEQIARTPKQVGDVLRRRRRQLGLSQTNVGERTSLRQATVSTVESGSAGTELGTLCNILAALDLELLVRPRSKAAPDEIEDIF